MNNCLLKVWGALIAVILLSACTTSKSTVSSSANLAKYEYVSVIDNETYHIPAELMEHEILLYDAVEKSNLQLINERRILELTSSQQEKLLLVKFGVNVQPEETIVIINFIDYLTGRPVASCRGAYSSLGITGVEHDINSAINRVAKQISETFAQ